MKLKHSLKFRLTVSAVTVFLAGCAGTSPEEPWRPLFDGESLDGWSIEGGDADYRVEDSAIVGSTVHGTPNIFLTTEEMYDDFILELEYKVDPSKNSGIQIRSNSFDHYRNGRVHGYQVEIDPSERARSGGIYDEARRGWLFPLTENTGAQQAFKQNEWNKYRIEAIGDTIQTWVNGVAAAYLIDDKTDSGFIALQVHSIGEDDPEGTKIMWRDIKILTENLDKYNKEMPVEPVHTKNNLTSAEKRSWLGNALGWRNHQWLAWCKVR